MNRDEVFLHHKIYPTAADIFSVNIKPIEEIKDDCIFIIDTNVLLIPYTTSSSGFEEITKAFSKLIEKKQLIIPAQVAREFAKNRPEKIKVLFQQLNVIKSKMHKPVTGQYPLLESLSEYKEAVDIEKQIQEYQNKYSKKINEILEKMKQWRWDDPVSLVYKELFKPEFIQEVKLSEEEIIKDLERRNKHNVPPGFKDKSKDDFGVGDLIIWQTILEVAKNANKDIVFVSGDEKNDWFYRSESQSLYPRFELIMEFKNKTDDKSLHIIKLSNLLNLLGATEEVVSEVKIRETEERGADLDIYPLGDNGYLAEEAVYKWLIETEPEKDVIKNNRFPDFIIENSESREGVEVISTEDMTIFTFIRKIKECLLRANFEVTKNKIECIRVVVVVPTMQYYHNLKVRKSEVLSEFVTDNVKIVFGRITENGHFTIIS
jgi:rRNA-processing protein FCF1